MAKGKKKRQGVDEQVGTISRYDLEGDLDALISYLQNERNSHHGYTNLRLIIEENRGWDYSEWEFQLWGTREETDAEIEKRLNAAKKARENRKQQKVQQEEQERKRLRELLNKYPDEVT